MLGLSILALVFGPVSAADKKEPIKIGIVLPFSGGLELFGQQGTQGAKMAVAEINAAGGVLGGRPFELIIEDDKTDPKTAVEKVNKLVMKDKVHALLGPITSANRDAMTPLVTKLKTPLLYATDYEGGVCNRYVFCYSAVPDHYIKPFIPHLMKNYGDSFYLFGADYVWPHKMNEAIKASIAENKGKVLAEEYTPFGVKDFASTIQKIGASGAKVLILTLPGADGQTFVKQFGEFGMKDKVKIAFMGFNDNYMSGLTGAQAKASSPATISYSRWTGRKPRILWPGSTRCSEIKRSSVSMPTAITVWSCFSNRRSTKPSPTTKRRSLMPCPA